MFGSLFHYTDVGAVRSIVENRELWLTDIRFLNDAQELNHGALFVVEALEKLISQDGLGSVHREAAMQLRASFDDHMEYWIDEQPTFVCSFSMAKDRLSQWRAYGSYAVEFDGEALLEYIDLFDCVYESEQKLREVESMVADAVAVHAREIDLFGSANGPQSIDALPLITRIASICKNSSFREEEEVRCAVDKLLPSRNLKFRQRGNVLIPYVTANFSLECIRAIHVGPMRDQELACKSMSMFVDGVLSWHRADGGSIEHEIEVIKSDVPYRAP